MYARQQHIIRQSESQQPQAVTLANPFRIPLHRKRKVKKDPWSKTPCASFLSVSFFWSESCGRRLTGELWHDLPYSSTSKIKKVFFVFCPHTLTHVAQAPYLSGFQGWGQGWGQIFTLTPSHPHFSGKKPRRYAAVASRLSSTSGTTSSIKRSWKEISLPTSRDCQTRRTPSGNTSICTFAPLPKASVPIGVLEYFNRSTWVIQCKYWSNPIRSTGVFQCKYWSNPIRSTGVIQ